MDERSSLDIAHVAVRIATELGVADVAISVHRNRFLELTYRDKKLERIQESTSRGLSATLYHDGRYSSHSTSDLRPDAVEQFLTHAVALTALLERDEHRRLPDPKLYEGRSDADLQLEDPKYDEVTVDQRKEIAAAVQAAAYADARVISANATVYDQLGETLLIHSNGFEGSQRSTSYWIGAKATVEGEGDARPEASWWIGDRRFADLDHGAVGGIALRRALERIGSGQVKTRRCPMVVENHVARRLLSPLLGPLSGRALQQRRSCFEGKLGQPVAAELMTVTDEPLRPQGFGSRHYDGEGIAAERMPVFDAGVLESYFIDTYYGRKLGWDPTTGSPSNLVFTVGTSSAEEIYRQVGEGILVSSFLGGNSDPTTGDYSFGIRGRVIEGGELAAPVSEMNITGNLLQLWNQLSQVGNDPHPYSSLLVPTLAFDDVQFSGLG